MVGIHFKKKILNTVHLETYTSYKEYKETHKLKVPMTSFICYCIHKFCTSNFVVIRFIPVKTTPENEKAAITLVEDGEEFTFLINEYEIPWTVALCVYPVIMAEDVIITGLCAVTRQICMFRNCYALRQEHEDGLLGFRHTCLQAPNEVSVWTKFCEIEIIRTVQDILTTDSIKEVPRSLLRFEEHMRQPVRIHNVYKVAQNIKKESLNAERRSSIKTEPLYANVERVYENIDPELAKIRQQMIARKQTNFEQQTTAKQQKDVERQINAKQTNQKSMSDLKTNTIQAERIAKSEHETNADQAEQKVKSDHETNAKSEPVTNAEQAEQIANSDHQTNADQAEQKAKSDCEANTDQGKQKANAEHAEQNAKSDPKTDAEQAEQEANSEHNTTADQDEHNAKSDCQTNAKQGAKSDLETNAEEGAKSELQTNSDQQVIADKQDAKESGEGSSGITRTPKSRKWKSHKKKDLVIDCSTKIEDLQVIHEFAEGPYLTLADLVLLPSYHVIIQSIGETRFESLLPLTYKWYKNLIAIPKIQETFMSLMSQFNLKLLSFDNMIMLKTEDVSLYKCDPKRHNPKKRIYTREEDIQKSLSSITEGMEITLSDNEFQPMFRWKDIPEHANPYSGYLPDTRVQRKSEQLQNLALAVLKMATDGDVIVDFCCGSGHLGILLAYLLPRCTIILLENKVQSLCRAKERVKKMRLTNVFYYQCNLDFFIGEFDIGIGLHACGIATDLILDKCLKQNARFVLSPCCYGAIHATCRMKYPRSKVFSSVPFDQYLCIAHAADQTHKEHPLAVRGARCMTIIDSDRAHYAEEFGYEITLMSLKPITCTPKNNLMLGIPTEK